MNTPADVRHVFEQLHQEGMLEQSWQDKLETAIEQVTDSQPWYVRTMIGFGSWLASLLLIVAILASLNLPENDITAIISGLIFVAGATLLRRTSEHDFAVQMTLAFCLAGQGLILFGVSELLDSFQALLYTVIAMQALMIMIYPDRILRFLAVLFCVQAIVLLLFRWDAQVLLHGLVFGLLSGFILLEKNSCILIERGWYERLAPVTYGLLIAGLAVLMLSTVYILPELGMRTRFFPYPWVSSLLCGLLLVYVVVDILRRQNAGQNIWQISMVMVVVFVLAGLQMPGLLVACLLILMGYELSLKSVFAIGIVFLVVFLAAWFYGLEVTLLAKSVSLVSAGVLLLLVRYGIRHWLKESSEVQHA